MYLTNGTRRAEEVIGIPGYLISGAQIVPVRTGDRIPTVVGYFILGRVEIRESVFPEEIEQIEKFRMDMRENLVFENL